MKIPNTPVGNGSGYYGHESGGQYISDHSDSDETDSPTQDGDFSEYLWMENEEEFDNQVIKQLEEEALMEQCIEAMLEDERDCGPQGSQGGQAGSGGGVAWSTNTAQSASTLVHGVESLHLHVSDSDELARGSTLNPNATEFVPRQAPATTIEGKA